jgi:hypothetical protein
MRERLHTPGPASAAAELVAYARPTRIDFAYPLGLAGAEPLRDTEDDLYGVRAAGTEVYYLTGLDPQEQLVALAQGAPRPSPPLTVSLADAYWRFYEAADRPGAHWLLAMARSRQVMQGEVTCGMDHYLVRGDGMVVLAFEAGHLTGILIDGPVEVRRGDEAVPCQRLVPGPAVQRKEWHLPGEPLATSLIEDE